MPKRAARYQYMLNSGVTQQILGPNPLRTFILISSPDTGHLYIDFSPIGSGQTNGINLNTGLLPLTLERNDIGALITQPVYVRNAAGGAASFYVIEGED